MVCVRVKTYTLGHCFYQEGLCMGVLTRKSPTGAVQCSACKRQRAWLLSKPHAAKEGLELASSNPE